MTDKTEKKIPVIECFGPTVQGEGIVAGTRTVFIRFGLCDYKCKMCDSMHAVDPLRVRENAKWLTQEEIYNLASERLTTGNCNSITYSGGNPCIHDLSFLTTCFKAAGVEIAVETQGTICPLWLLDCRWITVSPKGPGMGEKFEPRVFSEFLERLESNDHPGVSIKVVLFDSRDLEFASAVAEDNPSYVEDGKFFLSLGNPYPQVRMRP